MPFTRNLRTLGAMPIAEMMERIPNDEQGAQKAVDPHRYDKPPPLPQWRLDASVSGWNGRVNDDRPCESGWTGERCHSEAERHQRRAVPL